MTSLQRLTIGYIPENCNSEWIALKYADDSLKKDKEIVLEAVKQDGRALQYADDSLKNVL